VKPVSWKRVGGWIGAGIAVLLAICGLFMLIGWLMQ
jgi:hypothetical protein